MYRVEFYLPVQFSLPCYLFLYLSSFNFKWIPGMEGNRPPHFGTFLSGKVTTSSNICITVQTTMG